jgi:hypothetical protein
MANSKNTINNIPLLGDLNLNTLKTDISPFTGYNEKNSTVFGGELSPIWTKETELGNKATTYTIFNSKGKPFTFKQDSNNRAVFYNYNNSELSKAAKTPFNINLTEYLREHWGESDVAWAAAIPYLGSGDDYSSTGFSIFYLTYKNVLYHVKSDSDTYRGTITLPHQNGTIYGENTIICPANNTNTSITFASFDSSDSSLEIVCSSITLSSNNTIQSNITKSFSPPVHANIADPFLTIGNASNDTVSFVFTTKNTTNAIMSYIYKLSNNDWSEFYPAIITDSSKTPQVVKGYYIMNSPNIAGWTGLYNASNFCSSLNSPFSNITCAKVTEHILSAAITNGYQERMTLVTGHDGNYVIPGYSCYKNPASGLNLQVYSLNGSVASLVSSGVPVTDPLTIENNFVSLGISNPSSSTASGCYSYKKNDGNFWFSGVLRNTWTSFEDRCKSLVIDNRYIITFIGEGNEIYDIETETFIEGSSLIGYIFTALPNYQSRSASEEEIADGTVINQGAIFGGGYNAGFEINNAKFTGFLPNPTLMTGIYAKSSPKWSEKIPSLVQSYLTISEVVQSAQYNGKDSTYSGTYYPIDSNANVILPYNLQAKVVSGYTNNDMIISGNVAYPLIYYNNTQKIYSYYMLSAMENITNTFALQGQRYAVNDDNIFSLNFEGGIISNVIAVAYKKNMRYLGTLPSRAIFYSDFNKTFYQFTGDNIISKAFEASDIDKIYFVGQNPSSLSLWIATNKGIYVMSDVDMFRLEYVADAIYFEPKKAIVITNDGTLNIENDISLWETEDDMSEHPIKLATKYYGLGSELKAGYDCWYIRLHDKNHKTGKLKMKINTITDSTFQTEEKTEAIEPSRYDANDMVYIKFQPKYQSAVATQLELESDIAIYQLSLGINQNDVVAQQSKFSF